MKLFISWSGTLSHDVAKALRAWLPKIFTDVEGWVSSKDLKPGLWHEEVKRNLETSDAGLICLTRENCGQPWINFETGGLLYHLKHTCVFPLVLDVETDLLPSTLNQLQTRKLNREGLFLVVEQLNRLVRKPKGDRDLQHTFAKNWPELEKKINAARDKHPAPQVEYALQNLVHDYLRALTHQNPVFHNAVTNEIFTATRKALERGRRILDASVENYNNLLVELYRTARTTVFSTSLPEYATTWDSPLGNAILAAHHRSKANVTRVFVFETRAAVTARHLATMRKQAQCPRIDVRIYINQEGNFEFSTNYSRDFTVIDGGDAIGLTQSYGLNNLRAIWHFRDDALAGQLSDAQDKLSRQSIPLARWTKHFARSLAAASA